MTNALQQYTDLHDQQLSALRSHSPEALNSMRSRARQALDGAELPRKGSDDYEATDLEQVLAPDYGINVNRVPFTADASHAFNCDVPNMSTCMYYFFNDTFARSATASHNLEKGVVVESMAEAAARHPQLLSHYGTAARLDDPCTALNTMLAQDGMVVYVPDGVAMERPIQLVNIFNASTPMMAVRRILVVVGRNASARMLVCDHTSNPDMDYLSSQVVEIVAMEGATFDYYDLEESSERTRRLSSVFVTQAAGSNVLVDGITLLNGYTRNNYRFEVNGEHAESHLLGMTIAGGCQHVDNHTYISHNAPRCRSNEMLKYVLNDHAVGAFSGKILVKPGCPRIDAYQGNRNICASPEAKMYTKPQLEIYTDDVKCSHGATVGQLDQEAMFYMRTRGVSEPEARRLLMQAFVADVVDAVRLESLRDRLRHLVEKRFDGSLATSCQGGDCAASCHRHK